MFQKSATQIGFPRSGTVFAQSRKHLVDATIEKGCLLQMPLTSVPKSITRWEKFAGKRIDYRSEGKSDQTSENEQRTVDVGPVVNERQKSYTKKFKN